MNSCPPCNQACNQGRSCSARELPTEEQDKPIVSPEDAMSWPEVVIFAAVCVLAIFCAFLPAL